LIYLDSSAVVKLVRAEAESTPLRSWLASQAEPQLVSSALVEVEVARALWRAAPEALHGVGVVLARLIRVDVNTAIRARAAAYPDPLVRSLEAIHLATAEFLGERPAAQLGAFVSYDGRLAEAATAIGLPVVSPGS
jgi:predicted nucleic acid-binding protein